VDFQIRITEAALADFEERLADARGSAIKYGGGDPNVRKRLAEMSDLIGSFEVLESGLVAMELAGRVGRLKQEIRKILENAIAS
jgi:hypothetical protein